MRSRLDSLSFAERIGPLLSCSYVAARSIKPGKMAPHNPYQLPRFSSEKMLDLTMIVMYAVVALCLLASNPMVQILAPPTDDVVVSFAVNGL